ncbi:hypothetical protein PR003_g23938 [Phytophthora rubi]|uniref:Protein kinase domain-containing protein n=1 Tax=Phytophthora rubi TaxID=129364 RepID=A0A6A4CR69_9STRA|nr:hypothetical protein PR002_g23176 [Phytophthora rubi]KAE8985959.1 hypothetical protein PR001_g22743 [Phytophthora rubi]KAE9295740.1 hypothetical protein PR003_g23938 [Phytophthora rubi]
MAPELLSSSMIANEKTDVYSFGVLMNEVLHEEEPYQASSWARVRLLPFCSRKTGTARRSATRKSRLS